MFSCSTFPEELDDGSYWRAVAEAWQDSDRQPLTPRDWRKLLTANRPGREMMMDERQYAELAALPDRVPVFRGVNDWNGVTGISWTMSRERAEWFARRFAFEHPGLVIAGRVLRHRIIALFNARTEQEALVFPRFVYARTYTTSGGWSRGVTHDAPDGG